MKKSIRENSGSEVNLVNYHYMILELYNVAENQSLSLADRVVTDEKLLCWHLAQMTLNVVLYVQNALKGTYSLLI